MKVLVVGAAGALGREVVRALADHAGVAIRTFTRRPLAGLGTGAVVDGAVVGDLRDPAALERACAGVGSMFLVSSPGAEQVALETNAVAAAERAGVHRVVKVSNIPVPGLDSGLHANHRAIERRLAGSTVRATFLRPSFFTTVVDRQRELLARGRLVLPTGAGRIAWIDPRDIAAVAAAALASDAYDGPLHLTGPEALDGDEVAARLGVRRLDPPLPAWREAAVAGGLDPWLADSTVHLYEAVAAGALAEVTRTVEDVLGRPARRAFAP